MSPRDKETIEIIRREKMMHIERVALELFAENGYHVTTIATIAKKANISKGLLYNYYSSKEDLLRTLVFRTLEEMFALFHFTEDKNAFDTEITNIITRSFEWAQENKDFLKIYFGIMLQPAVLKIIEEDMMTLAGPMFENASSFFNLHGFSNPIAEVRYLNSMLDGIFLNYVMEPDTFPLDAIKTKIIDQYINQHSS